MHVFQQKRPTCELRIENIKIKPVQTLNYLGTIQLSEKFDEIFGAQKE